MANYDVNKNMKVNALKLLAQRTDARLDDAEAKLLTLIGSDANMSVRAIAAAELAAKLIPENAKESLDTLQEIAAWIQSHPDDASGMNAAIGKLQGIVAGIGGESDTYKTVLAAIEGMITASAYSHPTQEAKAAAFRKVGNNAEGHVVVGADVTKEDITALGIPGQDTTYNPAVASTNGEGGTNGLITAADQEKLNGVAAGATKVEAGDTAGTIKVNGAAVTVVEYATDAEINAMLDEVFGTTGNGGGEPSDD